MTNPDKHIIRFNAKAQVLIAFIGALGICLTALISNWEKFFPPLTPAPIEESVTTLSPAIEITIPAPSPEREKSKKKVSPQMVQKATIFEGQVTDGDGRPLAGVEVIGAGEQLFTNSKGKFKLRLSKDFSQGLIELHFHKEGYRDTHDFFPVKPFSSFELIKNNNS